MSKLILHDTSNFVIRLMECKRTLWKSSRFTAIKPQIVVDGLYFNVLTKTRNDLKPPETA